MLCRKQYSLNLTFFNSKNSHLLAKKGLAPHIKNLLGQLSFTGTFSLNIVKEKIKVYFR
jgi:hypothetical protein